MCGRRCSGHWKAFVLLLKLSYFFLAKWEITLVTFGYRLGVKFSISSLIGQFYLHLLNCIKKSQFIGSQISEVDEDTASFVRLSLNRAKPRQRWAVTSVHLVSNYPIWPLWAPIAREPKIPYFFPSEQGTLLFSICHRDRKQILIIVWTHRRGEKISPLTTKWVSIRKLQNTVALCVHSQECGLSYDSRWGWGGEWHHRLCSHLNPDTVAPCVSVQPHHILCEAADCARFSPLPQRIPPFLFLLLSSCLRMKWRKWHSISWWMVLDPRNPIPVGAPTLT